MFCYGQPYTIIYVPESMDWKFPGKKVKHKLRASAFHRKSLMLTIFWDASGPILVDFVDNSQTINSEYYINLLQETRRCRRKPNGSELYLLRDNAPIHTSHATTAAISKTGLVPLAHPPYSPDLAPSDFYLFNHLKRYLRREHFHNKETLKQTVNAFFDEKSPEFYSQAFLELVIRWKKCIQSGGSYIEK